MFSMISVHFYEKEQFKCILGPYSNIKDEIKQRLGLFHEDYYLLQNGKLVNESAENGTIHIVPRILGGKGGFGSMLRAIGAQIEKTTNREACRDLSGRRLRDINEEQRLKNWISKQAETDKETKARRKKKLEKLCEEPKYEFKDEAYEKERANLPEQIEDALTHGLRASCSGTKRKSEDVKKDTNAKKKKNMWIDDDLDDDLSSSDDDDQEKDKDGKTQESDSSSDKSEVLNIGDKSNKNVNRNKEKEDCHITFTAINTESVSNKEKVNQN